MNSEPITATGSHGEYQWLTTNQHDLDTLLQSCPQVVLGKFVGITSLDSGPLIPTDDEKQAGWQSRNGIAHSPQIRSVHELRYGYCDGFDEWYVF